MRSLRMRQHDYRLDGRCVYCRLNLDGLVPEDRTDEHIIPLSLNGTLVIRDGACKPCARRSNTSYEAAALNNDLLIARRLLELKSRRRGSKSKSAALPPVALGNVVNGGGALDIELSRDDYPQQFSLVQFQPPGILSQIDRGSDLRQFRVRIFNLGSDKDPPDVTTRAPMINGPFAMMLAKIAYCYTMAEYGETYFDAKDIRDLLLGNRHDVYNFVGNTETPERLATRELHGLYFRRRGEWLTVLVHLFASCQGQQNTNICTPYEVVVGRAL